MASCSTTYAASLTSPSSPLRTRTTLRRRSSSFKPTSVTAKLDQKTALQYRKLGDSDLEISEITLGTMTFGQQNSEKEAHEMLSYAFDNGINILDTAEAYPIPMKKETQGLTDLYIASWLKSQQREKRASYLRDNAKVTRVDAANIRESVEKSLKRLGTDYIDLLQIHWIRSGLSFVIVKYLEIKSMKAGGRSEYPSIVRASQVPSLLQLKDIAFPSSLSVLQNALRPAIPVTPQSSTPNSRSSSPYTRRPSPPRSTTPIFSRSVLDCLKRTNDSLTDEVSKLQNQVRKLKQKCDTQDLEIWKLNKNAKQAGSVAEERFSKCRAAKELVKSITEQMKEFAERLPPEVSDNENFKSLRAEAEEFK